MCSMRPGRASSRPAKGLSVTSYGRSVSAKRGPRGVSCKAAKGRAVRFMADRTRLAREAAITTLAWS
jgi:hypothetical protein